jgi:16S rRNA (guanine(527)-N(7))-methyltransferase RsmG
MGESDWVTEDERATLTALKARYGLSSETSDALEALVITVRRRKQFPPKWRQTIVPLIEDSLTGLQLDAVHTAKTIVDLGSGAGVPGLVLAAARPDAQFTLVDKSPDRAEHLRFTTREMSLSNVETVAGKVEPWAAENREAFDVVVSRNVRPVNVMKGAGMLLGTDPEARAVMYVGQKGANDAGFNEPDPSTELQLLEARPVEAMGRQRFLYIYAKLSSAVGDGAKR